jgi:hypothetical protein
MTATSIATALLVSDSEATVTTVARSLSELAIATETCSHDDEAAMLISRTKFEAVIIDSYIDGTTNSVLRAVRCSPSNRTAVTFAISRQADPPGTLSAGERPTFLLERPLSGAAVDRTFRLSFDMIVRERRRYFRCPTLIAGTLSIEGAGTYNCQIVNISEGGIRLLTFRKLNRGMVIVLRFPLSETSFTQEVGCEVCWCDHSGRAAGGRFLSQDALQKSQLAVWLARRLESILPDKVLDKLRLFTSAMPQVVVETER